jgi:hypothetical protein
MKPKNKIVQMLTPFVVTGTFFVVMSIYFLITDWNGWGGLLGIMGLFLAAFTLIIDIIIKKAAETRRQIIISELVIIASVLLWLYTR